MTRNGNAAYGSLLKNYIRGNKVITLLIIFLPLFLAYSAAVSNHALLHTPAELANYIAENQGNALLGMIGANTIEAATVWRIRLSVAVIMAVLNIILVIDTTRKDEDLGKLELLRAGAVGPNAPLTATMIKVYGANLLGGVAMMLGFMAAGFPLTGSFAAGMATGLCCCAFAAVAMLAAQVASNARIARGLSFGVVAMLLFLQIVANATGNENLLMWTPFGWCAYARPYAGENWLLFLFAVPAIALTTIAAYAFLGRRDIGSGYLQERKGSAVARANFRSPFALAWSQQRGMLFIWAAAYALMGLVIGSLMPAIDKMFERTTFLPELSVLVGGPGKAFLTILSYILTQVVAAYALMAILRMREEESLLRTELVLSAPVLRVNYMMSHLCIAYVGSAVAIALFGVCSGDFITSVSRIPAVWILASVAVLLYGIAPRMAAPVGWGLFGLFLLLEFLWEMRFVGNSIFKLSPFAWVYPGAAASIATSTVMIFIAAVLTGLGLLGFKHRNVIAG